MLDLIPAEQFHVRNVLVGFRSVPLTTDKCIFHSRVRVKASPSNTATIYIGPSPNVTTFGELQGFPLAPGESLDLEIVNPSLWAIADDIDQQLNWCGL